MFFMFFLSYIRLNMMKNKLSEPFNMPGDTNILGRFGQLLIGKMKS